MAVCRGCPVRQECYDVGWPTVTSMALGWVHRKGATGSCYMAEKFGNAVHHMSLWTLHCASGYAMRMESARLAHTVGDGHENASRQLDS